jgi:hypothetical protein
MKSCTKILGILLSSVAIISLLPSCVTTPEKKHKYDYGDEGEGVSQLPHTRPQAYEGNPFGNMPQSR